MRWTEWTSVFFATTEALTRKHWREVRSAGAAIVDLSGGLDGEDGVELFAPAFSLKSANQNAPAFAAVVAHPAAVMLAQVAASLQGVSAVKRMVVTLLEPASEHGSAGIDELQKQTTALLTFQTVPKELFDAQVAFNLQVEVGADAKVFPAETAERIRQHFAALAAGVELQLQVVQAPVFTGYTASVYVELADALADAQMRSALATSGLQVTDQDSAPSNLAANEQSSALVAVSAAGDDPATAFWLWMAVDNLRLAAETAVSCASTLLPAKPNERLQ